jgi:hypothetical protein
MTESTEINVRDARLANNADNQDAHKSAHAQTPVQDLALDLAGNAYDFLNESLSNAERAAEGEPALWKFAIVNIAQAIELLLKERLRREHFLLVYSDIDRKRNTVNVDQALNRLANCGVAFDQEDVVRLKRARDIRNDIVHFTITVDEEQLRAAYTDLFEFAHIFHLNALDEELHAHILDELWMAEATLMADFRRKFITYQGADIIKEFPSEILDSQFILSYRIDGKDCDRVRWNPAFPGAEHRNCHDCAVLPGQLHTPGCDTELCPKCGAQWITCDCEADEFKYVEHIDQWVRQE